MVDPQIIHEWLGKANEDFEFALANLKEDKSFFAQICFHFQQAAEKYLKTYIVAKELEFRKIHDLPLLLKICISNDPSLEELQGDCEYLTAFYVETRYPIHWPTHFSEEESQKAFQAALKVRSVIIVKLN